MHQDHRWLVTTGRVLWWRRAWKPGEAVLDQRRHMLLLLQREQALKGTYADVTVAEANHDG